MGDTGRRQSCEMKPAVEVKRLIVARSEGQASSDFVDAVRARFRPERSTPKGQ